MNIGQTVILLYEYIFIYFYIKNFLPGEHNQERCDISRKGRNVTSFIDGASHA